MKNIPILVFTIFLTTYSNAFLSIFMALTPSLKTSLNLKDNVVYSYKYQIKQYEEQIKKEAVKPLIDKLKKVIDDSNSIKAKNIKSEIIYISIKHFTQLESILNKLCENIPLSRADGLFSLYNFKAKQFEEAIDYFSELVKRL
jgi:hypothetical protein